MGTLYIKNTQCPFCKSKLINRIVYCPQSINIPCLECKNCKVYLYTEEYYSLLQKLANNSKRKLNRDVYKYQKISSVKNDKSNKVKTNNTNKVKSTLNKYNGIKFKKSKTINSIPSEKIKPTNITINYNIVKKCSYFKNSICSYFDNVCNPYSIRCINRGILTLLNKKEPLKSQERVNSNKQQKQSISQYSKYVKAVVLSHNRKCINDNDDIIDVSAKFKILINNEITEISIPAGYCNECDQYIILKSDFKKVKQKGTLLCQVIDKTPEYLSKHEGSYTSTESKIHSLGYNVIKQRYNYTFEQRKIILANIIENYGITQHEILSMLDTNIARKINSPSYVDAVEKWQQDREFVTNYKTGDIPEVVVNEVIVGKRK